MKPSLLPPLPFRPHIFASRISPRRPPLRCQFPGHFFTLECQSLITSVKFRLETEGYRNTGLRILSSGPYSPFLNRLQIKPNITVSLDKRIQIFILGTLGVFFFKCCFSWYFRNIVDAESLQTYRAWF